MRLFVAISVPGEIRRAAWRAAEPLRSAGYPIRWVAQDGFHLTLKFLGDVAVDREPDVCVALANAARGAKPFDIAISGFGVFPSARRPRVVWVGCEAAPPLELLQHRVEQEMERVGFAIEGRPFHPHFTLGRVQRGARASDLAGLDGQLERSVFDAHLLVEGVDLLESTLTPRGARYTARHVEVFRV